jgi:hypothetical protein
MARRVIPPFLVGYALLISYGIFLQLRIWDVVAR